MRPTLVITPSASTSAIFRLSAAWCCTFLTNSSLIALARAICEMSGMRDRSGGVGSGNKPPWCDAGTPGNRRPAVCTLSGCLFLRNTEKIGRGEFTSTRRIDERWSTLENSCQNAKQRDRPGVVVNTHKFTQNPLVQHTTVKAETRLERKCAFLSYDDLIYESHSQP